MTATLKSDAGDFVRVVEGAAYEREFHRDDQPFTLSGDTEARILTRTGLFEIRDDGVGAMSKAAQLLVAVLLICAPLFGQAPYFGVGGGVGGTQALGYAGADLLLESHAGSGRLFSRLPLFADNRAKFTTSRKFGSASGYTFRDDLSFLVRRGKVFFGPGVSVGHLESDRFTKTPVQFTAKVGYAASRITPFFMFRANEAFTLNKARNYVLGVDLDFPITARFGWRVTPRFAVAHFRHLGPGRSSGYAFDVVVMPVWKRR